MALCLLAVNVLLAQTEKRTYTISGTVVDAKTSEALLGANVRIQGTMLGSATGKEGKYAILATVAPGTYKIAHSLVGYKTRVREVQLGAEAIVEVGQVVLDPDILEIQEVVVTGTGTAVEKERLGNAITTVSGRDVAEAASTTVDGALAGKIPGALILSNSGTPGGGVTVRLRGTSTISAGAEPLYIVDGAIVDNSSNELVNLGGYAGNRIADLNPEDIDHIEVVKGAAAAALYGSRANNGVIQVFTKRGQLGIDRVTFRTQAGFSNIRKKLDMNMYPFDKPVSDPTRRAVTRTDYQDDIFRTGFNSENYLSIAGGSDRTKYYVSGTVGTDAGIMRGTDYRRINFRANLDQVVSSWLSFSANTNYINSTANRMANGGVASNDGVLAGLLFQSNLYDLRANAEGKFPAPPQAAFANPLEAIELWTNPDDVTRFIGSLHFVATPLSSVTLDYVLGYDQYTEKAGREIPLGSSGGYLLGFSQEAIQSNLLVNNDVTVTHRTSLENLGFTTSLGFSHQYFTGNNVTATSSNLLPVTTSLSSGAVATSSQYDQKQVIYGTFLQETVSFMDKLFLTGGVRVDAASTFGKDDRWQAFPKASLSYVVSNEEWWQNTFGTALNRFKLRTAWGASGGQPPGSYDRFSVYVQQSNSNRAGLVNSTLLGNSSLKPERMNEFEIGTDFGMFNDLVSVEFSYYNKTVKDLLVLRSLAPSTGFASIVDNVGELSNKGFELLVKGVVLNGEDFRWISTLTMSHNKNLVTKLVGPAFAVANSFGISRVAEGYPLGFFYGTSYLRNADGSKASDSLGRPIRVAAAKMIGDPNPNLVASFINDFQILSKLSLHVQFDGVFGGDVFNFTRRVLETPAFGNGKAYELELSGAVAPGFFTARRTIFEEYIEDGTFVKLRELSLTYTLDQEFIKNLGLRNILVTLTGRNLLSFDNYQGYDPEINVTAQSTLVRGFDFATIPNPRSYHLSLTFNL
jgi:TonB-linked SusC/RagA family outer membrane protein